MNAMRVAFLFLPRFPVQRRVVEQPSLAGQPMVLHADARGVQRVCVASGAALKRGVRPGMSVAAASALAPEVVRLAFDAEAEKKALASLGETLLPWAPGFQVHAPEGLWLDASAAPLSGGEACWAQQVLGACRAAGLLGRCVVGAERFTTQALACWRSDVFAVVPPRGGSQLLTLPLAALEEGWLGPEATAPFRALGLSTLGELAALSTGALVARFGAMGLAAARLSRGEDDSHFVPDALPEVLEESVSLDWPAELLEPVLFALKMVVDRLCARLQGRQLAAVRLTVRVGLSGGESMSVPLVLARPSSQARLLLELLRHRLTDLTVRQPMTTLSVRVDEAGAERGRQLALGDAPTGEAALEVVLSRLQSALGEEVLFSAKAAPRHRPEDGWVTQRFVPPTRASAQEPAHVSAHVSAQAFERSQAAHRARRWPLRRLDVGKAKVERQPEVLWSTLFLRPPRLFTKPACLVVDVGADGTPVAMHVAGRRRRVDGLWGPERLAGGWWSQEGAFARDYYRVLLEGVGQLWVFHDGRDGHFYAQGVFD